MIIGLDFDGVICDTLQLKVELLKELRGVDVAMENIRGEYLIENVFQSSKEEYLKFGAHIYGREYLSRMIAVKDALYYIPRLIAARHKLVVVSSRNAEQLEVANEWLNIQELDLDFVGVGYGNSKVQAVVTAGVELYVDDDFHKLEPLAGVVEHLILFTQGHNRNIYTGSVAHRVDSWGGLCQTIRAISILR